MAARTRRPNMINTVRSLPLVWELLAYGVLAWGLLSVLLFLGRYMTSLPWSSTPEGRHLVAMSGNIGAFFLVYLVQAVWPGLPGRRYILIVLLIGLVASCTWRWLLLERHLRERRRERRRARYRAVDTDIER